jgi:hypothetical protein
MSNIVDDLLQEVEQLEASTQAMDNGVQELEQQQKALNNSTQTAQNTLLLEATKTTQEASKQSHLAASTAIKLAEQLKARNSELEDLSNNWRQAVRNTLREQQGAKKYFAIMMGTTLAVSIISLSSIGYLVYLLNQQSAHHKGEVLDIIQTESKLLSNKLIVKTDELASLTEAMSADIKQLRGLANEPLSPATLPVKPLPIKAKDNSTLSLNIELLNTQHAELKTLIQQLISKQQTVKNTPIIKQHTTNPAQLKQLKDLNWLIRKQDKALKAIQHTLSGKLASPSNNKHLQKTLEALKTELSTLNQQQTNIQQQLKTLQEGFSKHLKKSVDKPPYSYKSSTDYKLN